MRIIQFLYERVHIFVSLLSAHKSLGVINDLEDKPISRLSLNLQNTIRMIILFEDF